MRYSSLAYGIPYHFPVIREEPENLIYAIALCNPTQVFKIAAISLFDPVLSVVGPVSFFILDTLGSIPFLVYAFCYFSILGTGMVFSAFYFFSRKDLL